MGGASDLDACVTDARSESGRRYVPAPKFLLKVSSHDVDAPDVGRLHRRQFTALDQVIQKGGGETVLLRRGLH